MSEPPQSDNTHWLVRIPNGDVRSCESARKLQEWIVTGKVKRDSLISKHGSQWKRLGEIEQLAPYFRIAEEHQAQNESDTAGWMMAKPPTRKTTLTGPVEGLNKSVPTNDVAFAKGPSPLREVPLQGPPNEGTDDELLYDDLYRPKGSMGKWILLGSLVVLLGAAGLIFYMVRPTETSTNAVANSAESVDANSALDSSEPTTNNSAIVGHDVFEELQEFNDSFTEETPPLSRARVEVALARHLSDQETRQPTRAKAKEVQRRKRAHLKSARDLLEREFEADRQNAEISALLAHISLLEKQPRKNISRYIARSFRASPQNPEALFAEALLDARDGNTQEARRKLRKFHEAVIGAEDIRGLYRLARLDLQNSKFSDALGLAEELLQTSPRHEGAKQVISKAKKGMESTPDNEPSTTPTNDPPPTPKTREQPTQPKTYNGLLTQALALQKQGKNTEAIKRFHDALDLDPTGEKAQLGLARSYLRTKRYSDSLSAYRTALTISPNNGDALWGIAETYRLRGDQQQAASAYKKYLAAAGNHRNAQKARDYLESIASPSTPE